MPVCIAPKDVHTHSRVRLHAVLAPECAIQCEDVADAREGA